jgi:(p)ppGpp synthase/HD superfamily hydrolase
MEMVCVSLAFPATGGSWPWSPIIATLLHDAIEDQKSSPTTIAKQFSEHGSGIVLEVTDDKPLPWQEREAAQIATASGKSLGETYQAGRQD